MNPYYQNPQQFPPQFQVPTPQQKQPNTGKLIFAILVPTVWIIALLLPAYSDKTFGVTCFIFGWSMIGANFLAFLAWLSNIPFFVAFFMFILSKKKATFLVSFILSVAAFIFSFGAFTVSEIMENEGGGMGDVSASYGTFVWIGAFFLLVTGSGLRFFLSEDGGPQQRVVQQHNQHYQQYPPQNFPSQQQYPQQNYPPQYPPQQQQNYPPQQNPFEQYPPNPKG